MNAAVKRFFCGLGRPHSADGRPLGETVRERLPWDYRAYHADAPEVVAHTRCSNCGAVLEGYTVDQIVRMRVSPWA